MCFLLCCCSPVRQERRSQVAPVLPERLLRILLPCTNAMWTHCIASKYGDRPEIDVGHRACPFLAFFLQRSVQRFELTGNARSLNACNWALFEVRLGAVLTDTEWNQTQGLEMEAVREQVGAGSERWEEAKVLSDRTTASLAYLERLRHPKDVPQSLRNTRLAAKP